MLTEAEKKYFEATRPLAKMEMALVRELVSSPTYVTKTGGGRRPIRDKSRARRPLQDSQG